MSRPIDPARVAARASGATRYHSIRPCPKCGNRERYAVNASCYFCACLRTGRRPQEMRAPVAALGRQPAVRFSVSEIKRTVHERAARECSDFKSFPASRELAEYVNTTTARARSLHLNRLIRDKAGQR